MHFPIPDLQAETAAKDLASDIRKLGAECIKLHDAIVNGESGEKEQAEYALKLEHIKSMSEVVFRCTITGADYRVGDYVTQRRERLVAKRKASIAEAFERVRKSLLH